MTIITLNLPIVGVIKKKINKHISGHLYESKYDNYYSTLLNNKRYVMCFFNNIDNLKCINLLSHQSYPHSIYSDTIYLNKLKKQCLLNNIGLFGVTYFNENIEGIDLLLNEPVCSINEQTDHLNYLFDIFKAT